MSETYITIGNSEVANENLNSSQRILQEVEIGNSFLKYINGKRSSINLSDRSYNNLKNSTVDILRHCNAHDAINAMETTHLVVGYVQSGKTLSFTALTALAKDNGYRLVIYLAGSKNNLLKQTTDRLVSDLRGVDRKLFKIFKDATINNLNDIKTSLSNTKKPIILVPILKHYTHIDNVKLLVKELQREALTNETVLIIDDEADQISLNGNAYNNSVKELDLKTRNYSSILALRDELPGNSYIQYTATPQANILISMKDLLSPKSHTVLEHGDGYTGGATFFGLNDDDKGAYDGRLIETIPAEEVYHPTRRKLTQIPESLKKALRMHILATILQEEYNDLPYLSMMVHPSGKNADNKVFKQWIDATLSNWLTIFQTYSHDDIDYNDLIEEFREDYQEASALFENKIPFDDIIELILDCLSDKRVYIVNSEADADRDIEWDAASMHILVGGEMLGRGFTIENLATSYMPRYTTGITNADTIQQRCRFFGYKESYLPSCRVFLPESSIQNYKDYVVQEEELRSVLKNCDSLSAVERQIMTSPKLRPTRRNILSRWVLNNNLSGFKLFQAFTTSNLILGNRSYVETFLSQIQEDDWKIKDYSNVRNTDQESGPYRKHRFVNLSVDNAIDFLENFNMKHFECVQRKVQTIRYLNFLKENETIDHVCFMQMSYSADPKHRKFNHDTKEITSGFAAGPSSDGIQYKGDKAMIDPDTVTIQLYHFNLEGSIPLNFEKEAYSIAINYPSELSTAYTANFTPEEIEAMNEIYEED